MKLELSSNKNMQKIKTLVNELSRIKEESSVFSAREKEIKAELEEIFETENIDRTEIAGVGSVFIKTSPGRNTLDKTLLQNELLEAGFSTDAVNGIIERSSKAGKPSRWVEFRAYRQEKMEFEDA